MEIRFCYNTFDSGGNPTYTYTVIPSSSIYRISKSGRLFDKTFKLGSTLCMEVDLDVDKSAVSAQPDFIELYENNVKKYHLIIDSCDDENTFYYSYVLTDSMVLFNKEYDWSSLANPTVQNILNAICSDFLGTTAPTVSYLDDLEVTWSQGTPARDFISYVAEVNASYARINGNNELEIIPMNRQSAYSIDVADCADFKVGEYHVIEKVVYEYGVATVKVPNRDVDGNTLYINSNNILITDDSTYTRESIITHIYNAIVNFSFYDITTSRCLFNDATRVGDIITFVNGNDTYKTIAQYDWNFNSNWYGGFSLDIETKQQQETKLIDNYSEIKNYIDITVDRAAGVISQEVTQEVLELTDSLNDQVIDLNTRTSLVEQTAQGLSVSVGELTNGMETLSTSVIVNTNGVTITKSNEGSYTLIDDTGMKIYVDDTKIAQATSEGFQTTSLLVDNEWVIDTAYEGLVLNFFKKRN